MKHKFSVLLAILINSCNLLAQGEVPVNMYTGSPGISINLYTLTDHDLSESVSMSYNVNTVMPRSTSAYGNGWFLDVGGQISRQVRGLPDDFTGSGTDIRKGWLYNSNYSAVLSFPNHSSTTNTAETDSDDETYLNNLNFMTDTEPDLFTFSVGGYYGKFIFDNTGTVQLIPYQDLLIVPTYTASPTNMTITGWTITTNTGRVYKLNETCAASRRIIKNVNQNYLTVFDRSAHQYSTIASYTSAWMLTSIQSPTGASLTYTYTIPTKGVATDTNYWRVQLFNPISTIPKDEFSLMTEITSNTTKIASKITTSYGKWVTCEEGNWTTRVVKNEDSSTSTYMDWTGPISNIPLPDNPIRQGVFNTACDVAVIMVSWFYPGEALANYGDNHYQGLIWQSDYSGYWLIDQKK